MAYTSDIEPMTVMGPAMDSNPRNPAQPPSFYSNATNKFDWRNEVRTWAQFIKMKADSGCSKSKAQLNALGFSIYMACGKSARIQLDLATRSGSMHLRGDINDPDRTKVVETIISIIAKDAPTDSVKRLVDMLSNIHSCIRDEGETPENFARRFAGLASEYITHCASNREEQDSQQFAIVLLRNARLPDSTMNTVIFQLMSQTAANPSAEVLETFPVSATKFQNIIDTCTTAKNLIEQKENADTNLATTKLAEAINTGNEIIKVNRQDQQSARIPKISFDDAVTALSQCSNLAHMSAVYCSL